MDFISIDLETTDLDPEVGQIIEFGATIVKDFKIVDTFRKTIYHEKLTGSPFALAMNHEIIREIGNTSYDEATQWKNDVIHLRDLVECFRNYLLTNKFYEVENSFDIRSLQQPLKIICAGKNFGAFDLQFLNRLRDWNRFFKVSHRILDPSILYFNAELDSQLPSLEECKKRSGLFLDTSVKHRADIDAREVAELLIFKLKK